MLIVESKDGKLRATLERGSDDRTKVELFERCYKDSKNGDGSAFKLLGTWVLGGAPYHVIVDRYHDLINTGDLRDVSSGVCQ